MTLLEEFPCIQGVRADVLSIGRDNLPENIVPIGSPIELPHGWYEVIQVSNIAEAVQEAAGRLSYFYKSNIIESYYLFVPTMEET